MSDRSEPARNIGSGAGHAVDDTPSDPKTKAEAVVDRLGELYWRREYGQKDAFACLVRTILSQNTSDTASQPAFDALVGRYDGEGDLVTALADATHGELAETIKAGGLYNQKATVIIDAAERVLAEYDDEIGFDEFVRDADPSTVRDALLAFDGVGPKTADCVLLFSGGREGVFPVDTHVHRIFRRLGVAPADADHEEVREVLEREVPPEKCGFGHTAALQFGREYCKARKPACLDGLEECPMSDLCDRVGVDVESNEVVDPAETTVSNS